MRTANKIYHGLGASYLISVSLMWIYICVLAYFKGDGHVLLDFVHYKEHWFEIPFFAFGLVYTLHFLGEARTWIRSKKKSCCA